LALMGVYAVGIIGTGRIAGSIQDEVERLPLTFLLPYSHAGAYAAVPSTRLVAAADTSADRLREFAARWQVDATYADYRTMLDKEHLDIVSICTPTSTHAAIAANVVASGVKAIFLEKPIAQSLADADGLIDAARSAGAVAAVNHFRTYDPYYRRVRQLIAGGAIGELHSITVHWAEGMLFGGTHLFDTLRFLTGDEASWVFGRLDEGDGVFDRGGIGMLGMRSGVSVFIDNAVGNSVVCEFDIVGTLGRIRIGNTLFPELYTLDPDCTMALTKRAFPASVVAKSPMTIAVAELVRALETGEPPASDLTDARADLELTVAFHVADKTGRVVSLPVTDLDYSITDLWGRYA
jgi:predicted dehydrogenase